MSHEAAQFRPDRPALVAPGQADLHERDMTATFAADLTLEQAQARLAEVDQWLPVDGDPAMAIGRMVEPNTTGPLRLGYGAWRDLLLGCQFHNGRGQLITAGGRTVKNVAGLDLTRLMVGQCGMLGTIATITSRTYRRPRRAMLARFDPDPLIVRDLLTTALRPQWAAITKHDLACGYVGDERAIEYYRSALAASRGARIEPRDFREDEAHRRELWRLAGDDGTFRVSVPPMDVLKFAEAAGLERWAADAAFGIVIGPAQDPSRITQSARAHGGTATFFSAQGCRAGLSPGQRDLLARLRLAFDPEGRLAGGTP